MQCDACADNLGAVLFQEGHPVAYESRGLNDHEKNLGIYEKEILAVIHALQTWKHYLLGNPFIIRMDHQSLRYFLTQTKLLEKKLRWADFLSQFDFHIAYIPGSQNSVADDLSRRPRVNAVTIAYHKDLSSMIDEYAIDPDYESIVQQLSSGAKHLIILRKVS